MGLSGGSKSTTKSGPAATALPYVDRALGSVENIVNSQQGNLNAIGDAAIGGYNAIAPSAFGPNTYLQGAQSAAGDMSRGVGSNYSIYGQGNPATETLGAIAAGSGAVAPYMIRAQQINTGADSAVAGGQYLNAQPSAGLYKDIIGGGQLNGNPYLQGVIDNTNAGVSTAANRQFAARGMGAGIGTPYANILSKNLATNEGNLRYQNYNDAANRQLTAAGQSDSAFANERGFMDNASGRVLAANTTNASNALAAGTTNAANSLNAQQFNSGQAFDAAQAQGNLFNANQTLGLNAQQASDQTRLTALGLTPQLIDAQYAGIDPAVSLLNASATLPYTGVNALAGNIANLTGATNSSTSTTKGPGLGFSILAGAAQGAGAAAAASDRRLKKNIKKVGELHDGLGVYDYDYIDQKYGEGRQRGVIAGEVALIRPWALGGEIDGDHRTVHYDKLERAA